MPDDTISHDGFDPEVERADEVEDYTDGIPRPPADLPEAADASVTAGGPSGFGDGDVADIDENELPSLSSEIADVEALVAERDQLKALAVRLQADFENFRKRATAQHSADIDRATGRLAEALLPVLDACEAAFSHGVEGVEPIWSALIGALQRQGLEALDLQDQPFDPAVAEAVLHEPADNGDGDQPVVVETLRTGYRWKDKVLRAAMVKVKG
jgi:molecular chaperone GrpE